jgi:hypothetical protein
MAKWDKPVRPGPEEITTQPLSPITGGGARSGTIYIGSLPTSPLYGTSPTDAGVTGESNTGPGVYGASISGAAARAGSSDGVLGESRGGKGVHGADYAGGVGVYGESAEGAGVSGMSHSGTQPGVSGHNDGGGPAGFFEGSVTITGNLNIGPGGDVILNDCAEHFSVIDGEADPGTVMVIDQDGTLRPSSHPYDKKVAGVVSGAGNYRPGIVLGKQQADDDGILIALFGKVYCKVDAQYSSIEVGDLLTTSLTSGHAMKARDQSRAFGSVIGKALRSLHSGQGLIPILVALQ